MHLEHPPARFRVAKVRGDGVIADLLRQQFGQWDKFILITTQLHDTLISKGVATSEDYRYPNSWVCHLELTFLRRKAPPGVIGAVKEYLRTL